MTVKNETIIDGKVYKKAQVVMLPTNEASRIYKHELTCKLHNIAKVAHQKGVYGGANQHLYLLSNENAEINDWSICPLTNKILQVNEYFLFHSGGLEKPKKIIASTDITLCIKDNGGPAHEDDYLPTFSESFIKKYIELYNTNNVINDVLVEINKNLCNCAFEGEKDICMYPDCLKLKTDSNNCITIKKIKNSWNRQEVFSLFIRYQYDCAQSVIKQIDKPIPLEWLNNNI